MAYQVGMLEHLRDDDPTLDTYGQATAAAIEMSNKRDWEAVGIWTGQDEGSDLVTIAFDGRLFESI